jgi:hypothetical protein
MKTRSAGSPSSLASIHPWWAIPGDPGDWEVPGWLLGKANWHWTCSDPGAAPPERNGANSQGGKSTAAFAFLLPRLSGGRAKPKPVWG